MNAEGGKNLGKPELTLVRGGLYGTSRTTPEVRLERGVRERFAAMMRQARDKSFYNVAEDVTHPTRVLARLLRRAKAKRVPYEQVRGVVQEIERYAAELYGRTPQQQHVTGEHRPAA